MARKTTMLELVTAVNAVTDSDEETVATVANLINSGRAVLCGNFAGALIDLDGEGDSPQTRLKRAAVA